MKIIDLLNKIANGEEVSKKIKYGVKTYNFDRDGIYTKKIIESLLFECNYNLNDEVEILEYTPKEEKKIPEKLNIEDDGNTITLFGEKENEWTILDNVDVIICKKINGIIDYLKSKGE